MILSLLIASLLVSVSIFIHYEVLRWTAVLLPRLHLALRFRMLVVVLACFLAHTLEVWTYALAYFVLIAFGLGSLEGHLESGPADYLYFSVTSYSTLGFGDLSPTGALRLVSGIEALNGLFLVAWSTSFTYLAMEQLWSLHPNRPAPQWTGRLRGRKERLGADPG